MVTVKPAANCYTDHMKLFSEAQLREIRWNVMGRKTKWLHPLYWWQLWRYGPVVKPSVPVFTYRPGGTPQQCKSEQPPAS